MLNEIGGEECIKDTHPVAKGIKIISERKLEEETEAPIPEYHFVHGPPTFGEAAWKMIVDTYMLL